MFSYTFLMIDDLKKNWKFKIIYNFSFFVTFRDNFQIHVCIQEYENFYSTLELLLIIHGQYYFQNILFAKHHYLNSHINRNSLNNPP